MVKFFFRLFFTSWPIFLGVLLPYVRISGNGFENMFWGLTFGQGFVISDAILGGRFPLVGALAWPALVASALYWLSGVVWQWPTLGKALAFVAMLGSALVSVTTETASQPPYNSWPTLFNEMSGVY